MSEYALAVERSTARLVGFDGSSAAAIALPAPASARGPCPESVGERLNAFDGEFLPCEIGGEIALVNLAWIVYVESPAEAGPRPLEPGLRRAPAELDLVTGETLSGVLSYVARPGAPARLRPAQLGERPLPAPGLARRRAPRPAQDAILRVRS